jgi:hypothetical protein
MLAELVPAFIFESKESAALVTALRTATQLELVNEIPGTLEKRR